MTSKAFCTDLPFSYGVLITWLGIEHVIFCGRSPSLLHSELNVHRCARFAVPIGFKSMPKYNPTIVPEQIIVCWVSNDRRSSRGPLFCRSEVPKTAPGRIEPTPDPADSRSSNRCRIPCHKKIGGKGIAPCRHRSCRSTVFALCL
jgi:hypothetical protein